MREFPCQLIRVINGNTIEADFDLYFGVTMRLNIRLFGVIDSPEAMTALIKLLPKQFTCATTFNKRSKVGRCLGQLYFVDPDDTCININEVLIAQGHFLDIT
jgi:hypothetical protein